MKRLLGLLLLLVTFTTPAFAQDGDGVVFSPQSIVVNPRPGFEVDVFLDRGSDSQIPTYQVGEAVRIGVRVSEDSYIYLFNVRPDGQIQQLLPNRYDDAGRNNFLRAGETRYFPPQGARYEFTVEAPRGLDKVIAVASRTELDTRQLAEFGEDPSFATSRAGEEGFARSLSIVVRPINQSNWVTDTTLLYVGEQPQQAAYGTLSVRSTPRDSTVYVNGEFIGYTPVNFGARPGRHDVRIERSGYATFRESVNVRPGGTTTIDAQLAQVQRTGSVSFTSEPRNAEVYIDGRFLGTTPTGAITLDAGTYQARFSLAGYQDTVSTVTVNAGGSQTVNAQMRSQAARLIIQANVGGAEVYLNGTYRGAIPNGTGRFTLEDVQPGTYELVLIAPGYRTFMNEVRISAGESFELQVRQERR